MSAWLRVIADDLTGACDVAAALTPMPHGIVVEGPARWTATAIGPLVVRNTQSRTLAPASAATRVRAALAELPAGWDGVLLKKIDTGLRGQLGAELDAAMDVAGAAMALVLPAIPEAGRTTVGGRQLVDGVPVHETAFARDPQNPVDDCRVAAVIEATSRRRAASVGLAELARDGVPAVLARRRAEGAAIVVGDAETDDDLRRWVEGLSDAARPLVVVGSTGVARALRAWLDVDTRTPKVPLPPPAGRSVAALVVAGSVHPATAAQLAHAESRGLVRVVAVEPEAAEAAGRVAARALEDGHHVALVPRVARETDAARAVGALAAAARTALEPRPPRALVLVGGETAFATLAAIGDPRLWIERSAAPLAVAAIVLDGPLAGIPLVTKGGSSGPPERLAMLVEEAAR